MVSLIERFLIAILQKMSIKGVLTPVFVEQGVIDFLILRLEDHIKFGGEHIFFLDFSTALLANIFHCRECIQWLLVNKKEALTIANRLLGLLKEPKIPSSVLMHILMSLGYLN